MEERRKKVKFNKALKAVLLKGNISVYRLSKLTGMDGTALGRLVKGTASPTWETTEKIAEALGKIDQIWRVAFLGSLPLPDDTYPEYENLGKDFYGVSSADDPETINKVIKGFGAWCEEEKLTDEQILTLIKDKDSLQHYKQGWTISQRISLKMQAARTSKDLKAINGQTDNSTVD